MPAEYTHNIYAHIDAIRAKLKALEGHIEDVEREELSEGSKQTLGEIRREWRALAIEIADVALRADEVLP